MHHRLPADGVAVVHEKAAQVLGMGLGLEQQNVRLDTTDMAALQQMLEAKRRLQNLDRLEIRL